MEAEAMRQRITDKTHEEEYYIDEEVLKILSDDGTTHVYVCWHPMGMQLLPLTLSTCGKLRGSVNGLFHSNHFNLSTS